MVINSNGKFFFRELTSTVIIEENMLRFNVEIPLVIGSQKCIFPPSIFDSMEHLLVHLAYEAWIAGQYNIGGYIHLGGKTFKLLLYALLMNIINCS